MIKDISEKPSPEDLKRIDIFQDYDENFLEKLSQDVSIAVWKKDAILFEEGTYIDVAFYVLQGEVEVFLKQLQKPSSQLPIFDSHRTKMFSLPKKGEKVEEEAKEAPAQEKAEFKTQLKPPGKSITFLSVMDFNLPTEGGGMKLKAGDFFGEIALLSGSSRSADVVALDFCKLLTLSQRDFRELLRRYPGIRGPIAAVAKERGDTNRQFRERPHGGVALPT